MPKNILESDIYREMARNKKSQTFVEPELGALLLDKNLDLYEFKEDGISALNASLKLVRIRIKKEDYKIIQNSLNLNSISTPHGFLKTSTSSFLYPDIIIEAVENKNRNLTNSLEKLQEKMANLSYAMMRTQLWSAH